MSGDYAFRVDDLKHRYESVSEYPSMSEDEVVGIRYKAIVVETQSLDQLD
jgi:hypothetical protein